MNGDQMRNDQDRREAPAEAQFISGWFTEQFEAGKQPDYGYPKNHLPETSSIAIEMVTGFMASKGK